MPDLPNQLDYLACHRFTTDSCRHAPLLSIRKSTPILTRRPRPEMLQKPSNSPQRASCDSGRGGRWFQPSIPPLHPILHNTPGDNPSIRTVIATEAEGDIDQCRRYCIALLYLCLEPVGDSLLTALPLRLLPPQSLSVGC